MPGGELWAAAVLCGSATIKNSRRGGVVAVEVAGAVRQFLLRAPAAATGNGGRAGRDRCWLRRRHAPPTRQRVAGSGRMLSIPGALKIFLAVAPTDLRKSHDGLAALVEHVLEADPLSGQLFVFRNKRCRSREAALLGWRWLCPVVQATRSWLLSLSRRGRGRDARGDRRERLDDAA